MHDKDSGDDALEENRLIERARLGDRGAVVRLFGDHLATVHRFAMRMCRSEDSAHDVAQESLLTALKSLNDFRGDSSFSTWLFTIARSHCGRLRRRRERETSTEDQGRASDALLSSEPAPEAQVSQAEMMQAVETGLAALEPSDREVILLRDVEGLSAKDAASVLEISVPALKSRLHRARAALRQLVSASVEHTPDRPDPSCPDVLAALSAKLEGDLLTADCAALEMHLARCPSCAARCESARKALGACAALRARPSRLALDVDEMIDNAVGALHNKA